MPIKELPLERAEEQFRLQRDAIQTTADWWFKEMNEAGAKMKSYNADEIILSPTEVEELQSKIKYLCLKSDWELKEQERFKKLVNDLLCRKIASSYPGNSKNV